MVSKIKQYFELKAFGVCTYLGEKLDMEPAPIRLFFIYTSFLTIGSPVIIYMILAFWVRMKNYIRPNRTRVWDL
ncbi:MAG: PspC domain-containing protein [Sphingobacteriales bacterium JAD_PAG50586_3]|nr:MAG: PspC domain-containing protein [Sphingobacteriales bacterium JAD_PAG50586_3]